MKYCITQKAKEKMALARHETGTISRAKYIALGTGGCDADGVVIAPSAEDTALRHEIIRKEYSFSENVSDSGHLYSLKLSEDECVGEKISEMALIDEDGDFITICCFSPKEKDDVEVTYSVDDVY